MILIYVRINLLRLQQTPKCKHKHITTHPECKIIAVCRARAQKKQQHEEKEEHFWVRTGNMSC